MACGLPLVVSVNAEIDRGQMVLEFVPGEVHPKSQLLLIRSKCK